MNKIFISYARKDDEAFAKKLYNDLTNDGFDIWWDKETMECRGRTFLDEIETAIIKEVSHVILVLGPHAVTSGYVESEWKCADKAGVCKIIVPILRLVPKELEKHPYDLVPKQLRKFHCIDFRSTRPYKDALDELEGILKAPVQLGKLGGEHKKLPSKLLKRSKAVDKLTENLVTTKKEDLFTRKKAVLIWGMPGMGKSVLARLFAVNCRARYHFENGVYWLKFNREEDFEKLLMNGLEHIVKGLKDDHKKYTTPESSWRNLRDELQKNQAKILFVLDNVWDSRIIAWFENAIDQTRCRMLTTICDSRLALGEKLYKIKKLTEEQALLLLAEWAGEEITSDQLPPEAKKIAKRVGYMPFALTLCGAMISPPDPLPWETLLHFCKTAQHEKISPQIPGWEKKEYETVYDCIKITLDALKNEGEMGKECANRYSELEVFPEGETLPESVIFSLWSNTSQKHSKHDLILVAQRLCKQALLECDWDLSPRQYSIHNLCTDFLRHKDTDGSNLKRLHGVLGKALLEWWQKNKFKRRNKERIQHEHYIMKNLFTHLYHAGMWSDMKNLLKDIEYLKKQQEPTRQYMFQKNFKLLLQDEKVAVHALTEILEGILKVISDELPLDNEKADWLDSFAFWINLVKIKDAEKRSKLKKIAQKFDRKCGEVSHALVKKKLKQEKNDWALRFAELRTWVYQRAGEKEDFEKCNEACQDAEDTCLLQGMEDAYQHLGRAEFIRMRANCLSRLSKLETNEAKKAKYKADAEKAYSHLNKVFAEGGKSDWLPSLNEWQVIEKTLEENSEKLLKPYSQKPSSKHTKFKAIVVSNTHDCISAIHIIRFLDEHGGLVQWIHHKNFEAEDFTRENPLFTVLIGGPKSPDISQVASEKFYNADKEGWLRMYNGLEFTDECIELKEEKTRCYMLGGPSKINTLMAAYKFTKNPKVMKIIKRLKPIQ